jgi:extracellular matrix regulatory protein A
MSGNRLINVGFGNAIKIDRILAVVNPGSSPIRKLKEEARKEQRIIDVTEGRRTRGIIILDSGHLILTSVQPETINQRLAALDEEQRSPIRAFNRVAGGKDEA